MSAFGRDPIPGMDTPPARAQTQEAAMPREKRWSLRICNGPRAGSLLELKPQAGVVGRHDPPSITVDYDLTDAELGTPPMTSRRHAEVRADGECISITDLGSTNGTFVDGRRLPERQSRTIGAPGTKIRLANIDMEVVLDVE